MARAKIVLALMALAAAATAQARTGGTDDDCALLLEQTRRQTLERIATFRGQVRPPFERIGSEYRLRVCADTTRAVTRGFSNAMAQAGMPVRWAQTADAPYCHARYLVQCVPFGNLAHSPFAETAGRYVGETWQGIRQSITAHMPWGAASNVSYFTVESLRNRFQANSTYSR